MVESCIHTILGENHSTLKKQLVAQNNFCKKCNTFLWSLIRAVGTEGARGTDFERSVKPMAYLNQGVDFQIGPTSPQPWFG